MRNGDGIDNDKKRTTTQTRTATTIGLLSKNKNKLAREDTFLHISLPFLFPDYNVKLSSYKFYGRLVMQTYW